MFPVVITFAVGMLVEGEVAGIEGAAVVFGVPAVDGMLAGGVGFSAVTTGQV